MTQSQPGRSRTVLPLITVIGLALLISGIGAVILRFSHAEPDSSNSQIAPPLDDPGALIAMLQATSSPPPGASSPARIEIPSIEVDAMVLTVALDAEDFILTPRHFAGYWAGSASLGSGGNTVIVGHNRSDPEPIFMRLNEVEVGDEIIVSDQFAQEYRFVIAEKVIQPIEGATEEEASRSLSYIRPTTWPQLTLITCSPDASCPDRLIVIATPAGG